MSEPFIAEIRPFAFDFAPRGWALCNGQELPINQNEALFSLLGTTYGGNGQTHFALPNLVGRSPLHRNDQLPPGTSYGQSTVTLSLANLPIHNHMVYASTTSATSRVVAGSSLAAPTGNDIYAEPGDLTIMNEAVSATGQSQPFDNMQPYLVINYCIALEGIYPSWN